MSTSKFIAGGNPAMDQHPIQGGVEILIGPLGVCTDFFGGEGVKDGQITCS